MQPACAPGLERGSNLGLSPAGTQNVRVWAEYAGGDFGGTVNGAQWEAGNVTGCSLGWTAGDHRFSRPVEAEVKGEGRVEEDEGEGGGGVVV